MTSVFSVLIRLKQRPRWVAVFVALNVVLAAVELGMHPVVREAAFSRLPPSATAQDRTALAAAFRAELPVELALLPLRTAAGWGFVALCLYYVALAFDPSQPVRFVQVFALEVRAEIAPALGELAVLLREQFWPSPPVQFDPTPPGSLLDVLPGPGSLEAGVLLGSVNIFSLWYLMTLALGVAAFFGYRVGRALGIVLGVSAALLGVELAILAGLRDLLALRL